LRNPSHIALAFASAALSVLVCSLLSSTEGVAVPPLMPLILSLIAALLIYLALTNRQIHGYVKKLEPLAGVLVAGFASLFAVNLLFKEGLMWTHDLTGNSLGFLSLFRHLVWSSLSLPRWIHEAWCGVPCLRFYPPLVSWLSALIPFLDGLGLVKIVLAASFFFSAFSMYRVTLSLLGDHCAASFSSLCYTLFGYHLLDCFIRGDLTETFSFVWLPLIYLLLQTALKKDNHRWAVLCGLALCLLILTHVLIGLLEILWLLLYVALFLLLKRILESRLVRESLGSLRVLGVTLSVALGLSAFFLVPALLELRYATISAYGFSDYFNLLNHFVSPLQVLRRTTWSSSQFPLESPGLPMYLGNVILFAAFSSILLVKKREASFLALYASGVVLLLLPTSLALPLFELFYVPPISTILSPVQFPWRLFAVLAFVSSLLAGYAVKDLHVRLAEKPRLSRLLFLLLLLLLLVDMYPYTGAVRWEENLQLDGDVDAALRWVSEQEGIHRLWCSETTYYAILSNGHYPLLLDGPYYDWKPVGTNLMFHSLGELAYTWNFNVTDFLSVKYIVTRYASRYNGTAVEALFGEVYVLRNLDVKPFFEVLAGKEDIESQTVESKVTVGQFSEEQIRCHVEVYASTGQCFLTAKESFFPGWQAKVNGEDKPVTKTENGLIAVEVPLGSSEVELVFARTPAETLGDLVSLATIMIVALYLTRRKIILLMERTIHAKPE
jgi:hypothetical protein